MYGKRIEKSYSNIKVLQFYVPSLCINTSSTCKLIFLQMSLHILQSAKVFNSGLIETAIRQIITDFVS